MVVIECGSCKTGCEVIDRECHNVQIYRGVNEMGRVIRRRKPRSNGGLREGGGIREQILPLLK